MDNILLNSVLTVAAFVAFLGIVFWAMAPRRKADFEEAARLPFVEGEEHGTGAGKQP
jgi:cytochrome c oxidase cbb3-type subunit IV